MPAKFAMLASGSSGNAAFLQADGCGLLIDVGLDPRLLASRLAAVGANWGHIRGVLLTHTHTDHWKDSTLGYLKRFRVPLYCHPAHHATLTRYGGHFETLLAAKLVHPFAEGEKLPLPGGLTCLPIRVPHDSFPTFAFRIDGPDGLFGPTWSVGYASDLGEIPRTLLEALMDATLVALEFNHDEQMQKASGRPRVLIQRVLSELGHLSNKQAAEGLRTLLTHSAPGALKHVVQLHLSRDCNRSTLAADSARHVLNEMQCTAMLTTARQDSTTGLLHLEGEAKRERPTPLAENANKGFGSPAV